MDDSTLKLIEQALGVKVHGGSFAATWVVLNWLGSRVKRLPSIPNDFIPIVLAVIGSVSYVVFAWLLGSPFEKSGFVVGFANGFVAVGGHQCFVRTKQGIAGEAPKDPPAPTP